MSGLTLAFLFVLIFAGGPLMFRILLRRTASRSALRALVFGLVLCGGAGLILRYGFPGRWGQDPWVTGASIALIWAAWIGILVYGAQALRRADPRARMRKWTAVIGAVGTTMPWFGLASAQLLSGG